MDVLTNILTRLRSSLWLVPGIMSGVAVGLAYLLLFSGFQLPVPQGREYWWLFSGDAATARDLLATLLGGMMTITSLVVSITMVVLSLAANQLGPRLIGNFIRDRAIQSVLGLFVGTILYCLLVLRSVDEELGADYVPHSAITVGTVLTVLCLIALLFYIHKIARSIIADTVVGQVAEELEHAIRQPVYGQDKQDVEVGPTRDYSWRSEISLGKAGYLQVIEFARLIQLAAKHDLQLHVHVRAGHFLLREVKHVTALSRAVPDPHIIEEVKKCFIIGSERTSTQDLEYSIRQLVEIAVRALSPGVNDPFTAIAVVDRLSAALESASKRPQMPKFHPDEQGQMRVVVVPQTFGDLLDAAFNQIRQAASNSPAVLIQMAHAFRQLSEGLREPSHREALARHVEKLGRAADKSLADPLDQEDFWQVLRPVCEAVGN